MTAAPIRTALEAKARALWNADREQLRRECPAWEMPAWSRARAWRKRPYICAAIAGVTVAAAAEGTG